MSTWDDLIELTAAQSSANTQLMVHDGDEAGDPKEKYMTRAEARIMILQALQYLAGVTPAADKLPYFTGATSGDLADLTAAGRTLLAAANAAAQLAALSGAPLNSPALTGTPTATTAAGSDSSTRIATTAQVQAAIALAVTGALELKGDTDASANPNYPAGVVGDLYYVSVAGKIGGASGKSVDVSDAIICKTDNAGGTEASVGTSWFVLEHNVAGALLAANNLSELTDKPAARTTLGLESMATQAANNVAITGGAINGTIIGATTPVQAQAHRPVNAQTGTSYTFVLGDADKLVTFNNGGSQTVTVPPNGDVAFEVNTEIDLASLGAGTVTLAPGSGVTIRSLGGDLALSGQYAGATLKKIATNEWLLVGSLA